VADIAVLRRHACKDENPVITFPIKKSLITELFIDRMEPPSIVNDRIKNRVRVVNHCYWLWLILRLSIPYVKGAKSFRNEKQAAVYFKMTLTGL